MPTSVQANVAVATPDFAKRKARALIGWLPEPEGVLWLAGRDLSNASNPAFLDRCRGMRASVASRPPLDDGSNIVTPLPPAVDAHVAALKASPFGARFVADAGNPMLVDLARVRAIQPVVHIEDAKKRAAGIGANDLEAIARLTIPIPAATLPQLESHYDPAKQTTLIASPDPNLRVVGPLPQLMVEIAPGVQIPAFGFAVALLPSYMQVVCIGGRYVLRDGYHRAVGLLSNGITHAPALVRTVPTAQEANMPGGMLTPDVYLGDHAPRLPDYLDDEVAAETRSPLQTKMVVIQALEVAPPGQ